MKRIETEIIDKIAQLGEIYPIFKEELERGLRMQNNTIKVKFNIPLEYIMGYFDGYKEGILELTEEKFKRLKENPMGFIEEEDILCDLKLIINNYNIEDWGNPLEVNYEVINDAE